MLGANFRTQLEPPPRREREKKPQVPIQGRRRRKKILYSTTSRVRGWKESLLAPRSLASLDRAPIEHQTVISQEISSSDLRPKLTPTSYRQESFHPVEDRHLSVTWTKREAGRLSGVSVCPGAKGSFCVCVFYLFLIALAASDSSPMVRLLSVTSKKFTFTMLAFNRHK